MYQAFYLFHFILLKLMDIDKDKTLGLQATYLLSVFYEVGFYIIQQQVLLSSGF